MQGLAAYRRSGGIIVAVALQRDGLQTNMAGTIDTGKRGKGNCTDMTLGSGCRNPSVTRSRIKLFRELSNDSVPGGRRAAPWFW